MEDHLKNHLEIKITILGIAAILLWGTSCSILQTTNPAELATPSEIPGGLAILDLTKDQAAKITTWEQQQEAAPRPEEYLQFIKSLLRRDQMKTFRSIAKDDHVKVAQIKSAKIALAAERYKANCGQYPVTAEDLSKDPGIEEWRGPYFVEILDPWGIPFQLDVVDGRLEVRSSGPDRNPKTDDDIIGE